METCWIDSGESHGQAFARRFWGALAQPTRKLLPALSAFLRNIDAEPPEPVEHEHIDEPAAQRPSHEIHFERFKKLHEFYVVEKTIEVYAPLRGEQGSRLLRLEALRSPQEHGYQVAVYIK